MMQADWPVRVYYEDTDGTGESADAAATTASGSGATSTGTATTAAAPSQESSTLPPALLIGIVVLVAGAGMLAIVARRVRRQPTGRHAG